MAADPAAVSETRKFLRRALEDWGIDDETTDTAVLCLSELVTNALIHARTGCVVRAVVEQRAVTITVRDGGSPEPASTASLDDPLQVHGRGLRLVDSLVTRWGSERDAGGTTVWFVLES
jgi:anti-sigma regulatory factor (Ser/Thr protein kinase)